MSRATASFAGDAALNAFPKSAHAAHIRGHLFYELGERDLSDRLLAERQTYEARRIELAARSVAHRALLKLALDAHELWLADED